MIFKNRPSFQDSSSSRRNQYFSMRKFKFHPYYQETSEFAQNGRFIGKRTNLKIHPFLKNWQKQMKLFRTDDFFQKPSMNGANSSMITLFQGNPMQPSIANTQHLALLKKPIESFLNNNIFGVECSDKTRIVFF